MILIFLNKCWYFSQFINKKIGIEKPKSRNLPSKNKNPDVNKNNNKIPKNRDFVPNLPNKKIASEKVILIKSDKKLKMVKQRKSMEDLRKIEKIKLDSFDNEMQKRGLNGRIKSIESLNNFLSFELGRNSVNRYPRNSCLYKETSTNSTMLKKGNKESTYYLNSIRHIRSNSNLQIISQNICSPNSAGNGKIIFPFQRRPQDETIKLQVKSIHNNFKGPISPRNHFIQANYFEENMVFKSEDFVNQFPSNTSGNKTERKEHDFISKIMSETTKITKKNI